MTPKRLFALGAALLFAAAGATDALSQSRVATSAAEFLTWGTGAQGSALGHAYTAVATGADALYWNPAGAARSETAQRGSVFFSHSNWFVETDYNAFGLTVPVTTSGVVGLSLAAVDYGRMTLTTEDAQEGTGETFGASDIVLGLSYAQPLTDRFYLGGTLKYVRQSIYDMSANSMAFDIGLILDSPYLNGLKIAASIMNFGGKMQMDGINARFLTDRDQDNSGSNSNIPARYEMGRWDLPLSFRFGLALPVVNTQNVRLQLLSDAQQTNDNSLNADLGALAEFDVSALTVNLRGGYKDLALGNNVTSHVTFGGGLSTTVGGLRFGVDYAYVPQQYLDAIQMIDLRLAF